MNVININAFVLYLILKDPDDVVPKAIVGFIIHLIIICTGAYFIAKRGKQESLTGKQ